MSGTNVDVCIDPDAADEFEEGSEEDVLWFDESEGGQ